MKALYLATTEATKKVDYTNPQLGPRIWRIQHYVRRPDKLLIFQQYKTAEVIITLE